MARFMPRSVRDRLRDQFSRLEQGSMTVSEYEARFHELSRHATMILPTEGESSLFCTWVAIPFEG